MSSYNFKDNLTINNNKYIKWVNPSGNLRSDILALDNNSNLQIKSASSGSIYINDASSGSSHTFLNTGTSGNVFIASKLGIGFNTTENMSANLTLIKNGFIGVNTTQGTSNNGYLGLSGAFSLSNTSGAMIILHGNHTTGNNSAGNVDIHAGNVSSGNMGQIRFFTGSSETAEKMQILHSGNINFIPNGANIRLGISDTSTNVYNNFGINLGGNPTESLDVSGNAKISGTASTGTLAATTISVSSVGSIGNLRTTNITSGTIVATTLSAGTVTGSNLSVTNVNSINVSSGNLTVGNLINFGGANLSFNSNTIGSIFTTGGNVGIGATNPFWPLEVKGDIASYITTGSRVSFLINNWDEVPDSSIGNTLELGINDDSQDYSVFLQETDGRGIRILSGIDECIRCVSGDIGGYVGIGGISVPNYNLDVLGEARIQTTFNTKASLVIVGLPEDNRGSVQIAPRTNGEESSVSFFHGNNPYSGNQYWTIGHNTWNVGQYNLSIGYETLGAVMSFTTIGNVGIGTTNPICKLDVNGALRVSGNSTFGGHLIPSADVTYDLGTATARWRDLYLDGTTIYLGGVEISTDTSGTISFGDTVLSTLSNPNIDTSIAGTITITSSGNVGIGTSNPVAKLQVVSTGGSALVVTGGNVGIGVTNPVAPLEVNGVKIGVQGSVDGGTSRGLFLWNTSDTAWGIYVASSAGQSLGGGTPPRGVDNFGSHAIRFRVLHGINNGFIFENSNNILLASINATTGNAYFRGNVGIGTVSPTEGLDVSGNAKISGTISAGTLTSTTYTGGSLSLSGATRLASINDTPANDTIGVLRVGYNSGGAQLILERSGTGSPVYMFNDANSMFYLVQGAQGNIFTVSSSTMTLERGLTSTTRSNIIGSIQTHTSGSVGVGIAPNLNVRLDVNGHSVQRNTYYYNTGNTMRLMPSWDGTTSGNYSWFQFQRESTSTSSNDILDFQIATDTHSVISTRSNRHLIFNPSNTGSIGIGTTQPLTKFDCRGNAGVQNSLLFAKVGSVNYIQSGTTIGTVSAADLRFTNMNGGTTHMIITSSGNVGIGTTNPLGQLHINNNLNTSSLWVTSLDGSSAVMNFSCGSTYMYTGVNKISNQAWIWVESDSNFTIATNDIERMTISNGGNVGIGTVSPSYPLHISSTAGSGTINSRFFNFNTNNTGTTTASSHTVSIYCSNGGVWVDNGNSFVASSDKRIKRNVIDITSEHAISTIKQLNPITYSYIDVINKGNKITKGFIAQEVEECLPEAVSNQRNFIPNIYRKITFSRKSRVSSTDSEFEFLGKIPLEVTSDWDTKAIAELQQAKKLKCFDENDTEIILDILNVTTEMDSSHELPIFSLQVLWPDSELSDTSEAQDQTLFVYGIQVDDFKTLEEKPLLAISIAAIKSLITQNEYQNTIINELSQRIKQIEELL